MRRFLGIATLWLAGSGGGCNRPETPPTPPIAPVRPMQPQAAEAPSAPVPPPPPKDAPAAAPHDTPDSPTTAPSVSPDKQEPQGTVVPAAPASAAERSKAPKGIREIHPAPGNTGCLEMYGTCTPPPDQLCTSSAFYLDCNAKGQLPSNGEWLHCVCP